jgi:hypothetical protein
MNWININVYRTFLGQIPIATGCCALIARGVKIFLPLLEGADQRQLEEPGNEPKQNHLTFDFSGAITLAIGISSLLTVIDLQNQLSWGHPLILSLTIVGTVFISTFLVLEAFPGNRELLMPLRLLKTEIGAFCVGQVRRVLQLYFPMQYLSRVANFEFACFITL